MATIPLPVPLRPSTRLGPWADVAACRDQRDVVDPDCCVGCEARFACLDHALRHQVTVGIWGGYTPEQRAQFLVRAHGDCDEALIAAHNEARVGEAFAHGRAIAQALHPSRQPAVPRVGDAGGIVHYHRPDGSLIADYEALDPDDQADLWDLDRRRVALDELAGGTLVTTMFGVVDLAWDPHQPPLLWETLVLGGPHDGLNRRYPTRPLAADGHHRLVDLLSAVA